MSSSFLVIKLISVGSIGATVVGGVGYGAYVMLETKNVEENNELKDKKDSISKENKTTESSINASQSEKSAEKQQSVKHNIFVIAESLEKEDELKTDEFSDEATSKNYTCKIENDSSSASDDECSIKQFNTTDTSKKYYKLSELTDLTLITPDNAKLKQANNLFKIEVTETFYDSLIQENDFSKKIEIVLKNSTDNKKFGKLKPLFGFKNSDLTLKTPYSVAKVSKITKSNETKDEQAATINQSATKCNFFAEDNAESGTPVKCVINDFGGENDNFSDIKFTGTVTAQTTINKDKYYLFQLSDNISKTIEEFKLFKTTTVTVEESSPPAAQIDTLELMNLIPATVAGKVGSQIVFLLDNITSTPSA